MITLICLLQTFSVDLHIYEYLVTLTGQLFKNKYLYICMCDLLSSNNTSWRFFHARLLRSTSFFSFEFC